MERIIALADAQTRIRNPKMRWMWGEALLGYALAELDGHLGSDHYTAFLQGFCDHYVTHEPRVDQADTSAPALITYAMQKKTGKPEYARLTDKVLHYIRHEPRLIDDAVNHLGNSPEGKFYPKSIWVDSLMMFCVFPIRYARENHDQDLLEFAARQPRLHAAYMQDPEDGLWSHSYWVKAKRPFPRKLYWGRGNGWVICSLPMILENLPSDHPERPGILEIFRKTSEALLPFQREDGFFETVLNRPGKTYREASATALIACGWFDGARNGWLPESYGERALLAYNALLANLAVENGETCMLEISAPTIPVPLLPYLGYKLTPRGNHWPYGIAAMIFAGIAHDKWTTDKVSKAKEGMVWKNKSAN